MKLKNDLVDKERRERLFEKLDMYEREGNEKILQNTTFTSRNTYVGYITDDKHEFDGLRNAQYEHVLYTDRENPEPDMKPLKDTLKLSQVQGDILENLATGKWTITSAHLPCSCPPCRTDPGTSSVNCLYKSDRKMMQHDIKMKGDADIEVTDDLGLRQLTRDLLRMELHERGIRVPSNMKKDELVELLTRRPSKLKK